jgi:hypothetical protein
MKAKLGNAGLFCCPRQQKAPWRPRLLAGPTVGGFRGLIPIPIVRPVAPTVKRYVAIATTSSSIPRERCPVCRVPCWRHGCYQRGVLSHRTVQRVPIYRQRCPRCGRTFGVLPGFLRPWRVEVTLVREAAVRSHYARGRPLSALVEQFSDIASARTVLRWLAEARARSEAVLGPISEGILDLFPGIDPTALLPAVRSPTSGVTGLLRLGDFYRRLSWARHPDRCAWAIGLFGLCNARGWAQPPI